MVKFAGIFNKQASQSLKAMSTTRYVKSDVIGAHHVAFDVSRGTHRLQRLRRLFVKNSRELHHAFERATRDFRGVGVLKIRARWNGAKEQQQTQCDRQNLFQGSSGTCDGFLAADSAGQAPPKVMRQRVTERAVRAQ